MKPITRFFRLLLPFFFIVPAACEQTPPHPDAQVPFRFPKPDSAVTLFFCGDIMIHEPQIHNAFHPEYDDYHFLPCFQHIAPYWIEADFAIANLETTLGDDEFSGYPRFRAPWQLARDLQRAGISALVLANNHCCDQGTKGIRQTLHFLDSLQIPHTGIFQDTLPHPLYLRKNGFKIALLNYTYGTNGLPVPQGFTVSPLDTNRMRKDIEQARKDTATHVVAFVHWGDEYHTTPNARQRQLARWLRTRGVDMIIGSHPHVVQPVEYATCGEDTTGLVAYSLGNFISNQSRPGTDRGLCLRVTLVRSADNHTRYHVVPIPVRTHKTCHDGKQDYSVRPDTASLLP